MLRRQFLLAPAVPGALSAAAPETPIDIGSRRELFVDRLLIGSLRNASLRLGRPVERENVLPLNRPWEGAFSAYFTVIPDGGRFRLYYRGVPNAGQDGRSEEVTCYAESPDGIRWTRPDLGLFEVGGTRANNVILAGQPPFSHNFCPFLDTRPGAGEGERFKALAGTSRTGLAAFASADGIRWRRTGGEPVLPAAKATRYDSQNLAFWSSSESRYVCYFRTFKEIAGMGGVRWISRATSGDFSTWTEPEEMSFGDAPPEHLYTNQTSPYFRAPHIYIGTAARFMPKRQAISDEEARAIGVHPSYYKDCSDAVLITTRGGARYDRTFLEGFLRPGPGPENWVSRTSYPALNVVETGPAEMSLYVNRHYGQPTAHLARFTLRTDGFASVAAPRGGGELLTRPLRFAGAELEIGYSTSAAGSVRVELQDAGGAPVPGFELADCPEIIGDRVDRTVAWRRGTRVAALAGKPVRLRFALDDAELYSFRFRPAA